MSSPYVIADVHRNETLEIYRLTIGVEETQEVQKVDEDGQLVFETETVQPADGEEGEPIVVVGAPVMETQVVVVPVEDFVFSAGDPRWADKSEEEVVRELRRLVRAALRSREEDAAAASPAVSTLPGVGDPL
jgi:hypothetical protein